MKIVFFNKEFDNKEPIGNIRKIVTDSVLMRKSQAGIKESIVIASQDAELDDIDPNFASELISRFEQNRELDAVAGKWDFPKEAFKKMPLLYASQRLWQYMDIALRHAYMKSPELVGRNSAFRTGIYAAVGGYNPKATLAEDLEIGWLIKEARGYKPDRIQYDNQASVVSIPRRAAIKIASGDMLVQQYGDFHTNENVRDAELADVLEMKRDFTEEELHAQFNAIYEHYARWKKSQGGWIDDQYVDNAFRRAMGFLGVKYSTNKNKVQVDNIGELKSNLLRASQ